MSHLRPDRETMRQGGTFLAVGLAATAIHALASLGARQGFHLSAVGATSVGYVCAVGVSYLGNARFTFGRRVVDAGQFVRFLVVSLLGFAANLAITLWLADRLGWPFPATLAVIVVVIPALSFTASKLWAFAERRGHAGSPLS